LDILLKMKNCLLPTILFGSIALISYVLPAAALSPVEIQRIAKQTTVQITGCEFGSGVIIRKNANTYTVLTVAHAVRNSGCMVTTPDNTKYPVERIKTFPNSVDLAVFTFSSNKDYPVAKLIDNSDRVEVGETIYISGFPLSTAIESSVFTSIKGDVVANPSTQQQGKGYSLIYSNNTLPGQSGGPVWNDKGEVIAIHGQGDVDSKSQETINTDVRVKTGYNLGITVNTFNKLAAKVGLSGYTLTTLASRSKQVDDLIASAAVKLKKGDAQGMLGDLDLAISLDPQNARAYSFRGIAKSELGDKQSALTDFDRAIALNPNSENAYVYRGTTKFSLDNKQGALADYDRAITLNPKSEKAYFGRGNVKSKLDDQQGAIADYSQSIAINPKSTNAYYNRGQARLRLDEYAGALADYDRVIAINPNYANAYFSRGIGKSKLGNNQAAIEDFTKAAELFKRQGNATQYRNVIKMLDITRQLNRLR
jgi:tetratricopeptide (TPR) repeat protein